jgi:hypothetical protein
MYGPLAARMHGARANKFYSYSAPSRLGLVISLPCALSVALQTADDDACMDGYNSPTMLAWTVTQPGVSGSQPSDSKPLPKAATLLFSY